MLYEPTLQQSPRGSASGYLYTGNIGWPVHGLLTSEQEYTLLLSEMICTLFANYNINKVSMDPSDLLDSSSSYQN